MGKKSCFLVSLSVLVRDLHIAQLRTLYCHQSWVAYSWGTMEELAPERKQRNNWSRCKLESVKINPFGNSTISGTKSKSESQVISCGNMEGGINLKLDSILTHSVHCKFLQGITGCLQVFPVVEKPCNIYRLRGNPMIIMGFTLNL